MKNLDMVKVRLVPDYKLHSEEQIDTPENIYNNPQNTFVATFMGTNPMNLIEAEVKNGFLVFANISIESPSFRLV